MSQHMKPSITVDQAIEALRGVDFKDIQRLGFHFQQNDYYSPLNDCGFLEANRDLWTDPAEAPEIDWDQEGQLETAREISGFVHELADVPEVSADPAIYHWNNGFWNNADALVQYGLVRSRQPRRVVEIGCGFSSLLLARALAGNDRACDVVQVEPYPNEQLLSGLPTDWKLHQTILQRAPLSMFDALEAGDILFYDGSHCSKVGSDVNWFFFKILPRLAPGVLIHLHDIFLPFDYPEDWIFERGQTWNEQYVLQAFLMHNRCYQITIANRYLWHQAGQTLEALYRGIQPSVGCSFWMEKTGAGA
jgi:hypothetical protein